MEENIFKLAGRNIPKGIYLLSPNFNQVLGPQNKTKWADFSRMVLPDSKV